MLTFFIGWLIIEFMFGVARAVLRLKQDDSDVVSKDSLEKQVKLVDCTVERVGEIVYLYDTDNNFIAQGSSMEELKTHLRARFKNYIVNLACNLEDAPSWLQKATDKKVADNA
jgi:hypothetical protein